MVTPKPLTIKYCTINERLIMEAEEVKHVGSNAGPSIHKIEKNHAQKANNVG